jgi:acetolactate synthase-1/2/3 large subunit
MPDKIRVGELVAAVLERIGVRMAFGIVSVHNTPLLDAISRRGATRFIMVRGEMGGTHMADAHARVSGALGVVITSTGPGAASAVSGLVEARFAGTPLLHITGQSATRFIDRGLGTVHDVPDQLGMLRAVSKAAYRVQFASNVLGTLMRAAAEALTPPRGPVSVEIPIDVQMAEIDRPDDLDALTLAPPPALAPSPQALDALVRTVTESRRPVLWAGSGARDAGGPIARLAKLGIAVATSWNGRGVLPEDHPLSIGALATLPEFERFYESVDLMIVAGSRVRGHETRDCTMRLPERRAQIDVDLRANGRTYSSELFVHADAALSLNALADRLEGRWCAEQAFGESVGRLKTEAIASYRRSLGVYESLPGIVRAAIPRDALWVRDISFHQTTWANRIFPVYGPRDSIYSVGAAIGTGMPLAIGAALAAPGRKTVAMCGDGGFLLNLGELWTAVQERPDICFLVMNDSGYGVIRYIQDASYGGRRFYDDLLGPNFEVLAKAADLPYWRAASIDALGANLQAAMRQRGPTLVELDMAAIGPFRPQHQVPTYAAKS